MGRFRRFIDQLRSLLRLSSPSARDPAVAARYCKEGWARLREERWREALRKFGAAEALDPEASEPAYGTGVTYSMMGDPRRAVKVLDGALAKGGDQPAARRAPIFCERGLAYMKLSDGANALDDYNRAVVADPCYPLTFLNRGQLMLYLDKPDLAYADLARGVRLSSDTRFLLAFGQCCAQRGEQDLALWCFASYLRFTKPDEQDPAHAERAQRGVAEARALGVEEAPWSHPALCWTDPARLAATDTVAALISAVDERSAFFVLLEGAEGARGAPLFGRGGIEERLNELADLAGPSVLALRLCELPDLFLPLRGVAAAAPLVEAEAAAAGGWVLVQDGAQLRGVTLLPSARAPRQMPPTGQIFQMGCEEQEPQRPPTALFEQPPAFRRSAEARTCLRCAARFAYYEAVVSEGWLVDFRCPACQEGAITGWLEERMRPGAFSTAGFLLPGASLEAVRRADAGALAAAGSSAAELGSALAELLSEASAWYEADPARYAVTAEDIVAGLAADAWPAEELGFRRGPLQVFLTVYLGYQLCPFTALRRPFSPELPGTPMRVRIEDKAVIIETVIGQALPCTPERTYRFADRDFVILNREDRTWLKGPGLIAHLLHDHGFCEDPRGPYRVDPTRALQVLRCSAAPD